MTDPSSQASRRPNLRGLGRLLSPARWLTLSTNNSPRIDEELRTHIENVGYRPNDNLKRWSVIEAEIRRDKPEQPSCLEIGSNFGFMSANFANTFRGSRVFSVEGSFGTGNAGSSAHHAPEKIRQSPGISKHVALREKFDLANNIICLGLADAALFRRLLDRNIRFDYLISLSVFHWIIDASRGVADAREVLADHLRIATTTFLELPAMTQGKPLPGIYKDYVTIPQAITEACAAYDLDIRITHLCSCDWYGTRDTYRIDNISHKPNSDSLARPTREIVQVLGFQTA